MSAPAKVPRYIVIADYFGSSLKLFRDDCVTLHIETPLIAHAPPKNLAAKVLELVSQNPTAAVVFMAGNTDIQVEFFRETIFSDLKDPLKYITSSVFAWCTWIKNLKLSTPVLVCTAYLPTVTTEWHVISINHYLGNKSRLMRAREVADFMAKNKHLSEFDYRTNLVDMWNGFLKVACERNDPLTLIDINAGTLDDNGRIDSKFHHITKFNHTMIWERSIDVWQMRLELTDADLREPRSDTYVLEKSELSETRKDSDQYVKTREILSGKRV